MARQRTKTLSLCDDTIKRLSAEKNGSKFARMAIMHWDEIVSDRDSWKQGSQRNWRDLKLACAMLRTVLVRADPPTRRLLIDALAMDDYLESIFERDDAEGYGVDFIIGRVRALGVEE